MDNQPRGGGVFDVNQPGHSPPDSTSRPLVVGHRPEMADPMVNHRPPHHPPQAAPPPPSDQVPPPQPPQPQQPPPMPQPSVPRTVDGFGSPRPAAANTPTDLTIEQLSHKATLMQGEPLQSPPFPVPISSNPPSIPRTHPGHRTDASMPAGPVHDSSHGQTDPNAMEPVHMPVGRVARPKKRLPILIVLIIVGLFAAYLLLDSGIIDNDFNLPFHIFQQEAPNN